MNQSPSLNQLSVQKIFVDGLWHWQFGDWLSNGYPFLEERPWTPQIIGNKLCFAVQLSTKKWQIVWGNEEGQEYDDAFDIIAFNEHPLYIARFHDKWFLVYGKQESQKFPFQIGYRIIDAEIFIHQFPYSLDGEVWKFNPAKYG